MDDDAPETLDAEEWLWRLVRMNPEHFSDSDRQDIEQLFRVGEPTVALECICGVLAAKKATVSRSTWCRFEKIAAEFGGDMSFCDGIRIADGL